MHLTNNTQNLANAFEMQMIMILSKKHLIVYEKIALSISSVSWALPIMWLRHLGHTCSVFVNFFLL